MRQKNSHIDVFKYIDMSEGDDACWPWKGSLRGGKGRPYFSVDGKKLIAYRIVYELFNGEELKEGEVVRHTCDNGESGIGCCNPAHLIKGSHQDNMNDMKERERHGLPHHTVKAIRKLLSGGQQTQQEIADKFGVSRETVSWIKNERIYKHVK